MFQLLLYLGSQWAFVSTRTMNNWTRRASASKLFLIKGFPLCGLLPRRGLETHKFPCTEFFFISWGGHEGQQVWPPTKDVDAAVKATASSLDRLAGNENKSWKFWLYFPSCNQCAVWPHFTEKYRLLLLLTMLVAYTQIFKCLRVVRQL